MCTVQPFNVDHVICEPGDHTRYDFLRIQLDDSKYAFIAYGNSFAYPALLFTWELDSINTFEDIVNWIKEESKRFKNVNPFTLLQCVNGLKEDKIPLPR